MVGWLDGLDGWMVGWLDGCMVGWLDGWMAGWLDCLDGLMVEMLSG
jgi:organic anion transporter 5A